jgi:hypothetical protein
MVVDGLERRAGVLEFSFLVGCGLFGFLFTQAVGVVRNPGMAPEGGVCKALVMSTLCAWAVYLGWKAPARARPAAGWRFSSSLKWMYMCGVVCIGLGLYASIKLVGLHGGVLGLNAVAGRHPLVYQGLPVIYAFFAGYSYLGMVLVTLAALRWRSWLLAAPAAVPILSSLGAIVLAGRRTELILLGLCLGCVLYFARKIAPPRPVALALAPLAMAAIFVAGQYRDSTLKREWGDVRRISASKTVHEVLSGRAPEFLNMAYMMEIADTQGLFQGGVGFYNSFIQYFVPKLIVGEETKANLYVQVPTARDVGNRFDWVYTYGLVPTGPYSVFEQFWYLGALCYFFLARWLRGHWIRAVAGDRWSQIVYSVAVTFGVTSVVNDIFSIYMPVFMFVLPLAALSEMRRWLRQLAQPYSHAAPSRSWADPS